LSEYVCVIRAHTHTHTLTHREQCGSNGHQCSVLNATRFGLRAAQWSLSRKSQSIALHPGQQWTTLHKIYVNTFVFSLWVK